MNDEVYHQRYTVCGKANCRTCRDGKGHGPYWYAYSITEEGKTKQRYIGKSLPPGVLSVGRHHEQALVGRTSEMERLRSILTAVERTTRGKKQQKTVSAHHLDGSAQCVVLTGEIGIGKTRLLEEFGREAQARQWNVVWEKTVVQERHFPYQLWSTVLQKVFSTTVAMQEIEQHPQLYQPLQALIPQLRELLSPEEAPPSMSPEQEQLRLWEAVRTLLNIIAKDNPLLIVLDDLHWSDDGSCELLAYLARRISGHSIVIVGTCRDKELPENHALRPLLTDLQRERVIEIISLDPLSKEQIATLVAQIAQPMHSLSEPIIEHIQDRAAGNPFFAEELVRGIEIQNDTTPLPTSITAVLDLRLSRLSKECHRLLSKAAVLGGSFEFQMIQAMESTAGQEADEDTILNLLEEGLKSGMLTEEGVGTRITYLFWHPLLVSHLYEGLSAVRRANLHRRAADILRHSYQNREEEGAAIITHHLVLGGDDSQHIIHYAELAGDRAYALSAYPDAERQYTIAVEYMTDEKGDTVSLSERKHLASLLERLAECISFQGKAEEARHQYERILAVRVPLDDQQVDAQFLALLWAEIGWTWRYSAETAKALRCCEQGEQVLRNAGIVGGPAWATLCYQRGSVCWQEGNYEDAIQHAQTSLTLFEEFLGNHATSERPASFTRIQRTLAGDPIDPGRLHILLAALFATIGQSKQAEAHLQIALTTFERYECQREMATVLCNLGDMYVRQAKYPLAQSILERAITITERIGDRPNRTVALANAGILALRQHDLNPAEGLLTRALNIAEQIDDPIYQSLLHSYLSMVQRECGRLQEAKASLCSALRIGRAIHSAPCIAFALISLAQYRFFTSREDERIVKCAKRTVDRALSMEEIEAETRAEGYLILAQILFSLGEKQQAFQVAQQSLQQATHDELLWLVPRAQEVLKCFGETA